MDTDTTCFGAGSKDLEYFVKAGLEKGQVLVGEEILGIYGSSHLFTANLFLEAAAYGGKGGVACHMLPGQGLYDAGDPWNIPKGSLLIKVVVPTVLRHCQWLSHH